jgi:hypothetical protein
LGKVRMPWAIDPAKDLIWERIRYHRQSIINMIW